jgi:hypothetical protein
MYPCPIEQDPRYIIARKAEEDSRYLEVLQKLDMGQMSIGEGKQFLNADGIYYHDSRTPFIIADETGVTGATTDKLIAPGARTALPANYFTAGKRLRLTYLFRYTTGTTPGNLGMEIYYGTTDAGGTLLASSGAVALVGTKTNITCKATAYVQCRLVGSSGSLLAWGEFVSDPASAVLTNNYLLVPATAPAAITVDTTSAQGINIQLKNSGANTSSYTCHDIIFEALN